MIAVTPAAETTTRIKLLGAVNEMAISAR